MLQQVHHMDIYKGLQATVGCSQGLRGGIVQGEVGGIIFSVTIKYPHACYIPQCFPPWQQCGQTSELRTLWTFLHEGWQEGV